MVKELYVRGVGNRKRGFLTKKEETVISIEDPPFSGNYFDIVLLGSIVLNPREVRAVYDAPISGQEREAKGRDGKSYWVKLGPWEEISLEEQERRDRIKEAEIAERAGRYGDAANLYEQIAEDFDEEKFYEKAGELRRMERTQYVISANIDIKKDGAISIACPHCNASQPVKSKSSEVTCSYCGRKYVIPKKILDMI